MKTKTKHVSEILKEQREAHDGRLDFGREEAADLMEAVEFLEKSLGAAAARIVSFEVLLSDVYFMGHNDDCIFCGLKDKAVMEFLQSMRAL